MTRNVGRVGILDHRVGDISAVSEESVRNRIGRRADTSVKSVVGVALRDAGARD